MNILFMDLIKKIISDNIQFSTIGEMFIIFFVLHVVIVYLL